MPNLELATKIMIDDEDIIRFIYRNRCIMCRQPMVAIHELDYRSSGKDALNIDRRVPLCAEHHDWAHEVGKKVAIPILEKRQETVLKTWARTNELSKHLTLMNTKKNVFTLGIQQEDPSG